MTLPVQLQNDLIVDVPCGAAAVVDELVDEGVLGLVHVLKEDQDATMYYVLGIVYLLSATMHSP